MSSNEYSYLNKDDRATIWETLNPLQQEVLTNHRRYMIQSLFLNDNYVDEDEWEFIDLKIDHNFPDAGLRCECGRRLMYQFILKSKKSEELLYLGSVHFEQHFGVPAAIAKEVREGVHSIDWGMDLILKKVAAGFSFPTKIYQRFIKKGLDKHLSKKSRQRLEAFREANLPIYRKDEEAILALMPLNNQRQNSQLMDKTTKAEGLKDNPIKRLIQAITYFEVGEYLDTKVLAKKIREPERNVVRWLGLLQKDWYLVRTRVVGENYYRIK